MSSSQVWGVWQGDTFGPTLWAVFASKEAAEGHAAERRERTEETIEVRAMDVLTEPLPQRLFGRPLVKRREDAK